MPKFVTIGYGDQVGYENTPPELRAAAHANDAKLKQRGALIGMAGPPVQVRNTDSKGIKTQSAAFMSSTLPIAGFAVIEAADIEEAVAMVAQSPCGVAHGVVDVWPLIETQD